MWLPLFVCAQDSLQIRTNYYAVAGNSARELRRSLDLSRPRDGSIPRDALTTWRFEWRSSVERSNGECRLNAFTTSTSVTITFPRWTQPSNAAPELVAAWNEYVAALMKHEWGHAQLALPVAAEMRKRAREISPRADCEEYKRLIAEQCRAQMREMEGKQKDYDRQTRHGVTQGAIWPRRATQK